MIDDRSDSLHLDCITQHVLNPAALRLSILVLPGWSSLSIIRIAYYLIICQWPEFPSFSENQAIGPYEVGLILPSFKLGLLYNRCIVAVQTILITTITPNTGHKSALTSIEDQIHSQLCRSASTSWSSNCHLVSVCPLFRTGLATLDNCLYREAQCLTLDPYTLISHYAFQPLSRLKCSGTRFT